MPFYFRSSKYIYTIQYNRQILKVIALLECLNVILESIDFIFSGQGNSSAHPQNPHINTSNQVSGFNSVSKKFKGFPETPINSLHTPCGPLYKSLNLPQLFVSCWAVYRNISNVFTVLHTINVG